MKETTEKDLKEEILNTLEKLCGKNYVFGNEKHGIKTILLSEIIATKEQIKKLRESNASLYDIMDLKFMTNYSIVSKQFSTDLTVYTYLVGEDEMKPYKGIVGIMENHSEHEVSKKEMEDLKAIFMEIKDKQEEDRETLERMVNNYQKKC